jgi:AcrR family transcriptional regulator
MMDTDHSYLNELDGVYPAFQARSRLAQERLLRAGDAVFASKGYDKAHVTDIAAAAGYSIGTFYGRFRDKEALFAALQIRFARRGSANIDRFFDLQRWHDATPAELIETYIEGTSRVLTRNSGFFRALYQRSLAGEAAAYWPELRAATRQAGLRLADFIRKKVPEAGDPELDERCVFCLRAVEGMLVHRLLHWKINEEFDQAFILKSLTRMTTTTLGLPSNSK